MKAPLPEIKISDDTLRERGPDEPSEQGGVVYALYAGAVDQNVGTIDLRDLGPSFYEMATEEFSFDPRLTVYDVIADCDVPHLITALDDQITSIPESGADDH